MRGWKGLRQVLGSRQGALTLAMSAAGALAMGLLPDLVQTVPVVGTSWWWMALVALAAVVALAVAANAFHAKSGVGMVLFFGERGWDESRLRRMQTDALTRHPHCFTVKPAEFSEDPDEAVRFAFQAIQARLAEVDLSDGQPEEVSFYITARHEAAYTLGGLVKDLPHAGVLVRDSVGTGAAQFFDVARLNNRLLEAPGDAERSLLDEQVLDGEPEWTEFASPEDPSGPELRHVALVLHLAKHNVNMVYDAHRAAQQGGGHGYRVPNQVRCSGALTYRGRETCLRQGRVHYEALVRHVAHHWKKQLDELQSQWGCRVRGVLFVAGPCSLAFALGYVLGSHTLLAPYTRPSAAAGEIPSARGASRGSGGALPGTAAPSVEPAGTRPEEREE